MKTLVLNVAVLALGFVALALWSGHQRQAELERTSQDMAELSRSVEQRAQQRAAETSSALQRVEQRVQARTDATAKALAAAPPGTAPGAEGPAGAPPGASPPPAPPEPREIAEHVEAAFHQEEVDRDWAPQATRALQDRLRELLPEKSSLRSLECHASLCRLEVVHPSDQQHQEFIHRAWTRESLWKGASMTYREERPDGTAVTISYLAREGYELPFPGRSPSRP